MAKSFAYPDTIPVQNAQLASKTRKLPDGQFEAVAALFFMGRRGLTVYATGATRNQAAKLAIGATETQSKLTAALATGRARIAQ